MSSLVPLGLLAPPGFTLNRRTRRHLSGIKGDELFMRATAKSVAAIERTRLEAATALIAHGMAAQVLLTEYQRTYEGLSPLAVSRVGSVADLGALQIGQLVAAGVGRLSE